MNRNLMDGESNQIDIHNLVNKPLNFQKAPELGHLKKCKSKKDIKKDLVISNNMSAVRKVKFRNSNDVG